MKHLRNISVAQSQLDHLILLGCQYGQGYLFSRPLDPIAALDLLEKTCFL